MLVEEKTKVQSSLYIFPPDNSQPHEIDHLLRPNKYEGADEQSLKPRPSISYRAIRLALHRNPKYLYKRKLYSFL